MKIAFLSNFTADLIVHGFIEYFKVDYYISPYNQYFSEVINKNSGYNQFAPQYSVFILDGNLLVKNRNVEEVKNEIELLYNESQREFNNYFIISNIHIYNEINNISNYNTIENTKKSQNEINRFLNLLAEKNKNFFVLDILSVIEKFGYNNLYDNSLWYYGKMRYGKTGNQHIIQQLVILINGIQNNTKKCLVVDLDNTLWGGIIGEDGIDGIKLGPVSSGEVYYEFQIKIKSLKSKGVLLAICSKNNESDVLEVFAFQKYMMLSIDDFIIRKINWEPKDIGVKSIAQELNISEDSLVFIDDNKFERELVKAKTNAIVPDFPDKTEDLIDFITTIDEKYFSKLFITVEDENKTEQYSQNIKRENLKNCFSTIEEYILSLKMVLTVCEAKQKHISRISQLTQKTNQFNFSTKRYSELDIETFLRNENYKTWIGSVKDKFGDYGIVILIIAKIENDVAIIDTFLMSCRIIGRFIENAFIEAVFKNLIQVNKIICCYIPNEKNSLLIGKAEDLGFSTIKNNDEIIEYELLKKDILSQKLIEVKYA
jgi:FkbH-like protein